MINDTARLMNDVRTIVSTISPETDEVKLTHRLEEIIYNYNVNRKSNEDLENDLQEKIEMYINARRIEGYSEGTTMSLVTSEDSDVENAPGQQPGTWKTFILNPSAQWRYSHQEFKPSNSN